MNIEYFNDYLRYEAQGLKTKAKEHIRHFIRSFNGFDEKESWTLAYLPKLKENSNKRVRNELFEHIIFPVLLKGYADRNVPMMLWLAKLCQNYYQNHGIWEKMKYTSDLEIIAECYAIDPSNDEVRDLYLKREIEIMDFSAHEWPTGILYGNHFASKDECKTLLEGIDFIHTLDKNKKYLRFIHDYKNKVI